MISYTTLPAVNAILNVITTILLLRGYMYIRKRKIRAHRYCMVSALVSSTLFLTSYLVYHYHVGSQPFTGQGPIRLVYFTILISHTVLAVAIVPLVLMTVRRAWKGNFERHARIARRTLPIWLYVSVTGVVVYWMLYQL